MPAKSGRKAKRPRVHLLWGQEDLRKREALESLLDELVPPEDRDLDVQYIDATNPGVTGEMILNAARDRAMFSEQRVVVVLHAGRLRGQKHQRTLDVLAQGIPSLPEYSTLIMVAWAEEAGERRGRSLFPENLMSAIRAEGKVHQFSALKPEELAKAAMQEAADAGKQLAPAAAAMLVERAGPGARPVLQEVRKLISFVGDRPAIRPADVAELVPPRPDDNVFHLIDAAMTGDRPRALALARQLRESGTSVHALLPLLARALRQVTQAKYLQERGIRPGAEADQIPPEVLAGLPEEGRVTEVQSWLRERLWDQGRRITWDHLHLALDRLGVMDAGMKGWEYGIEDPELALEVYVVSLCETIQTAAPSGPRRAPAGGFRRSRG